MTSWNLPRLPEWGCRVCELQGVVPKLRQDQVEGDFVECPTGQFLLDY